MIPNDLYLLYLLFLIILGVVVGYLVARLRA